MFSTDHSEEYLSVYSAQLDFPTPPLRTGKKRATTRNQYTQLYQYPSPLSPLTSLGARRNAPKLELEEADGGGRITTCIVLLTRDASCYHLLACRLATGSWPKMDSARRRRLEEEVRWLDMVGLLHEVGGMKDKVKRGGDGYI